MTEPIVIDASAGVELILNTSTGAALRDLLPPEVEEWAPDVYVVEVAAVLRRAEIAGRITSQRAATALSRLLAAPMRRVSAARLLPSAWTLRHNLTVADGMYVTLARELSARLVTVDHRLANAPGIDIDVITPPALPS